MDKKAKNLLFVTPEEKYGSDYKAHCLEIYKIYVERADAISSRRESANTFFLSVNTLLIGLVAYFDADENVTKLAIGIAGIIIAFFWFRLLGSYKGLNTAKFQVIHEIEKKLPLSPYEAEWEFLGRGDNAKCYRPFTHLEMWVPRVFLALHAAAIVLTYWKSIVSIFGC